MAADGAGGSLGLAHSLGGQPGRQCGAGDHGLSADFGAVSAHCGSGAGVVADFYKSTNQDYIVHCEIREGKTALLDISLSVPDREQAESMCSMWDKKNQEIYAYVMKALMTNS